MRAHARRLLLIASLFHVSIVPAFADAPAPRPTSPIQCLSLPAWVPPDAFRAPASELRAQLLAYAAGRMEPPDMAAGPVDAVVIFVDPRGVPIVPERPSSSATATELSVTFDSPGHPWSESERAQLQGYWSAIYPLAREVYGDPAFSFTLNVRYDPNIAYSGIYYSGIHEMVLRGASPDLFCHELIHAFRDSYMAGRAAYEEGMARAAEVEIMDRLPQYSYWDRAHGYYYDVFYEAHNKSALGGTSFTGALSLLEYQLAGYAWGKVYLENGDFFRAFNRALYAGMALDPSLSSSATKLEALAASVQSSVEGEAWNAWRANQSILNLAPPPGTYLVQRVDQLASGGLIVDAFLRDTYGYVATQTNTAVNWQISDDLRNVLATGSATTNSLGFASVTASIQPDYRGMLRSTVWTSTPGGVVADSSYQMRVWNSPEFHGVTLDPAITSVRITSLDTPSAPVTALLDHGGFVAPGLGAVRGRFQVEASGSDGLIESRQVNKDASGYFLLLGAPHTPVISAPLALSTGEGEPLSLVVSASTPGGDPIEALSADLQWLPLGHGAVFTTAVDQSSGTLTWTPTFNDARPSPYNVIFRATSRGRAGSSIAAITVLDRNRPPVANAGGPYQAVVGEVVAFEGRQSHDPDGDPLTYAWNFGDGATGVGGSATHVYASAGDYDVSLVVTDDAAPPASASDATTASISAGLPARLFTQGGNRSIRLGSGRPAWCALLEPVDGSFQVSDLQASSLVMRYGTGAIAATPEKAPLIADRDRNGVDEIEVWFAKDDLRALFVDLPAGSQEVAVVIEGRLASGSAVSGRLSLVVTVPGRELAASLMPNPLRSGSILSVEATREGPIEARLYDVAGRLIRILWKEGRAAAGRHDVDVDGLDGNGRHLASGIYLVRVRTTEGSVTRRLVVVH